MSKTEPTKQKSAIEQTSMINEIIKRENRFHSINKVFTLNPKKCINLLENNNSVYNIRKTSFFKFNPRRCCF